MTVIEGGTPNEPGYWQSITVEPTPEQINEQVTGDRLDQALDAMRAHVTRGTFTAAQRDNALLLVLRVCIGLVRLALRRYEATD